ncbi:MAG: penicillin-binding protein 2 [Desulfobacterales bacterium]|nr:MAG: penicillin-binding protein 2 [Desulfobacterales bacterium]
MKTDDKKYIRFRMILVGIVFSCFFATIGAKAVYLQVYCGAWLSQKAANQYESIVKSSGKRGKIYDKNLREMAVSIDVTSIAAHPVQVDNKKTTARLLSKVLKIDKNVLVRKLTSGKKFVWIKRQVTPREGEAVRNLGITGIDFIPEHNRFYPSKISAAQVLGFTDIDDQGIEGLEFYYDSYLRGKTSKFMILKDALGRGFDAEKTTFLNYSGNNLVLTIDRTIQYITEKALSDAVAAFSARSGMAIVMVPKTGAILALAHVPFFNPNTVSNFNQELWRNRIITDPFEPGSTMKVFSAAAAIESGSSTPNSIFYCENGAYKIGRNVVHDTHKHGWLSLQQIIKHSSNIGAIKFIETTGAKQLYKTLRDFGFGTKTGVDCPGESAGSLAPYQRWTKIDTGAISFGQGISVSALQLITATCAIANDGILMRPYIVQGITDQNGRLIKSFRPKKNRRAVSSKTALTVRRLMRTVVTEGGTGVNAAIEGYSVCGKTGTAQKINQKGEYTKDKYISSFVGFLPAESPKVAILVVVDEPQKNHYGGVVAAPAFKNIAEKIIDYMDISPTGKSEKLMVAL